ncbi:MAG: alpha/beta hydrolase [bacterium]
MKARTLVFLSAAALCGLSLALSCSPPDVRMGMAPTDTVKLSYRIIGKGKPLVVIHDGPGYEKSMLYKGFDGLSPQMRVIYYDQRGCGRSEPVAPTVPLSVEDNVRDLEHLRSYLRLRKMSLAAHGWGAVIALEYARAYPRHVESIILIAPMSPFEPDPEFENVIEKLPPEARERIEAALEDPTASMLERRETIMRETLPSLFFRKEAAEEIRFDTVVLAPDVNLRLGPDIKTLDLFTVLGEVPQPALVIVGRHDISSAVRDQIAYADGMKQADAVVFNGSGHFPFLEENAFFLNLVRAFLRDGSVPTLASAARTP